MGHSALDVTRDGEVACQRRPASVRIAKGGYRGETLQGIHIGHAQCRCAVRRESRSGK